MTYPVFSRLGIIPWNFFLVSTGRHGQRTVLSLSIKNFDFYVFGWKIYDAIFKGLVYFRYKWLSCVRRLKLCG